MEFSVGACQQVPLRCREMLKSGTKVAYGRGKNRGEIPLFKALFQRMKLQVNFALLRIPAEQNHRRGLVFLRPSVMISAMIMRSSRCAVKITVVSQSPKFTGKESIW